MNLLIDQREMMEAEAAPEPQPFDYEPAPTMEEPIFEQPARAASLDYLEYERPQKTKSYFFPVFMILLLLAAIAAATYFGFFYKPGDLDFLKRWGKRGERPVSLAPPQEKPTPVFPAPTADAPADLVPPPAAATTVMKPVQTDDDALATVMTAFSKIIAVTPPAVKLGTLVMDHGSFSLEVSHIDRPTLEKLYSDLRQQIPCEFTTSPAAGQAGGMRTLMTATFTSPASSGWSQAGLNAETVSGEIRKLAQATGLSVVEITPQKTITKNNSRRTPIFIKVRGDQSEFEAFGRQLSAKGWNLQVAKLILLDSREAASTFVLRLELAQPA
ncbi:MAG TPA: hypothetical protein PK843_04945 [bacterium]|nr:hypothetical protein [bacterium]HPN33839.1 hypothetical protein [bacterium]